MWRWIIWSVLLGVGVLVVVCGVVVDRAAPILQGRVIETLSARFHSRVELDRLRVSAIRGLEISGEGLRIFAPGDAVEAGATTPLIAIGHFEFHTGLRGLFLKPMHVGVVHVTGMEIHIPPREMRWAGVRDERSEAKIERAKVKIVVDELVCDDSRLVIGTEKAGRDPKVFALGHIVLRDVGSDAAWSYEATLENPVPKGDIRAQGTFGPWVDQSPGDSPVTGRYTFAHADLNTIKGIGGVLSSVGEFAGKLNRIDVKGTAEVPNFSLDTANHPMPLRTRFSAIVDGLSGDTTLQSVEARLGRTAFTCGGSVVNTKGVGHTIDLEVNAPDGRLEDFLQLAVKTRPVVMTARVRMKTKLHLGPGRESVPQRLAMRGEFMLTGIHFSNARWQEQVNMVSLRAQGYAAEAKPGAPEVETEMKGSFVMSGEKLTFSDLDYTMPGATVALAGVYSLDGEEFDIRGKVRTVAKVSQMVSSWWKQILLYPANQVFQKNGAGAEIPVTISGTKSEPKFGLDLFRDEKNKGIDKAQANRPPDRTRPRAK